ncbi:FAD-binding protein [Bradyrhizobium sp. dw_78]|uniref:FAD-binding protein n=1 Tax=Bradyrhizobium sp. dw_78 TaxID=2719793 RepID=UPI001BD24571|nr:FAD-binding protein [Bradyrhizobium sp. dw_78]
MSANGLPITVEKVTADVVVVGGGGAASRAALSARQAGANVRLLTKAPLQTGGSTVHGASEIMSMGAAGFGDALDSTEIHYQDTMRAGRGFIDAALVRVLAEDAPERITDLMDLGVTLDRSGDGSLKLIRSDFGSYARALGVSGKTGKAFVTAISEALVRSGVQIDAPVMLVDLIRDADGAVAGVLGYDPARKILIHYEAPSVVMGTGGIHGVYQQQVSTSEMTGDGQAICFRHGAEMVNLEFHQVGSALIHPYVQLFSGSCFSLHPKMLNARGEEFLPSYLPDGVTVDEVYEKKQFPFTTTNVSRFLDIAMAHEIAEGRGTERGAVLFSFADVPEARIAEVMPNTARWMRDRGIDPKTDKLEVGVAFQCMNGGVRMTGADAQSSIPGLYVIGELAGGVRGPDRPGGNSLAEGQVFGHRAGTAAAERSRGAKAEKAATLEETFAMLSRAFAPRNHTLDTEAVAGKIRETMQRDCLVEKSADGLNRAIRVMSDVRSLLENDLHVSPETLLQGLSVRNMAQTSELVLRACLNRDETRSAHYRLDHPESGGEAYAHSFVMRRDGNGIEVKPLHYDTPASKAL